MIRFAIMVMIGMLPFALWAQHHHSGYGKHMHRAIVALSDTEMQGLLKGEGMGMALVAELNHYPGPRHVLDLADSLNLNEAQRTAVQKIFDEMHRNAVKLGKEIIQKERHVQHLLQSGQFEEAEVGQLLETIGQLRGQLRWVHIRAHLQTRTILSPEQIARYDQLRGYRTNPQ